MEKQKPFNDAMAHLQNIEGHPGGGDYKNIQKMPKPLRYFGYFMFGFMGISVVLIVVLGWILD